jgi:hypothetical protein
MDSPHAQFFLMIWGIIAIASVVVFLDWRGRRKERQTKRSKTAS